MATMRCLVLSARGQVDARGATDERAVGAGGCYTTMRTDARFPHGCPPDGTGPREEPARPRDVPSAGRRPAPGRPARLTPGPRIPTLGTIRSRAPGAPEPGPVCGVDPVRLSHRIAAVIAMGRRDASDPPSPPADTTAPLDTAPAPAPASPLDGARRASRGRPTDREPPPRTMGGPVRTGPRGRHGRLLARRPDERPLPGRAGAAPRGSPRVRRARRPSRPRRRGRRSAGRAGRQGRSPGDVPQGAARGRRSARTSSRPHASGSARSIASTPARARRSRLLRP